MCNETGIIDGPAKTKPTLLRVYLCGLCLHSNHLTLVGVTLVVYGADDDLHFTPPGAEWHADPFHATRGADALLMINVVGHGLGGIAGWDCLTAAPRGPKSAIRQESASGIAARFTNAQYFGSFEASHPCVKARHL